MLRVCSRRSLASGRFLHSAIRATLTNHSQETVHNESGSTARKARPEPRRPEEMQTDAVGFSKTKLFFLSAFGVSLAYGYVAHDEDKYKEFDVALQTEEPWAMLQRVFGFWILSGAKIRHSFRNVVKYFAEPPKPVLLPPLELRPNERVPLTIVLDLDETLVHTQWDRTHGARTRRRPFTKEFLHRLALCGAEIVVFSSASMFYTDGIVAALDPKSMYIHHRLGKEYTDYKDGKHIKDLSRLNRELSHVIIIDDNPECYSLHPENAITISKWTGDKSDTALRDLLPFVESLAQGVGLAYNDVRAELKKYDGEDIPTLFKKKAQEKAQKQQKLATLFGGRPLMQRQGSAASAKQAPPTTQPQTQTQATTAPTQQTPAQQDAPQQEAQAGWLWTWLQRKNQESAERQQRQQEAWQLQQQAKEGKK